MVLVHIKDIRDRIINAPLGQTQNGGSLLAQVAKIGIPLLVDAISNRPPSEAEKAYYATPRTRPSNVNLSRVQGIAKDAPPVNMLSRDYERQPESEMNRIFREQVQDRLKQRGRGNCKK
jgi:hypothetical protein